MSSASLPRGIRPVKVASLRAIFDRREHGIIYVHTTDPLREYPARVTDRLAFWAEKAPTRTFLAQRGPDGGWQKITYAEAFERVRKIAAGLLRLGLSSTRPLIILSENSIEHGLVALGAMHVGIPYAPIAPAYSLGVHDFNALRHVWENLEPYAVFVQDSVRFIPALHAVMRQPLAVIYHGSSPERISSLALSELEKEEASPAVDEANSRVEPDSLAKILYTSGSTGLPKGVITTHGMLCSNQQMLTQVMPCLAEQPPVLCDWLPWNHTFGGSHNFGIALCNGGSFYIDGGRPVAGFFSETIRNLRDVPPTAYFNVPKGYEMLVEHLRADSELRDIFFRRLNLLFFAAAGLKQSVWDELQSLAVESCGQEILVVTGLGATETAPFALSTGIEGSSSGRIGLPVPGVELKLVPVGDRLEARVRGPSITPGFWKRPDLNATAFDEESFYCMGDAIRFFDPQDPQKGFAFDGRLNEEFKLSSGTWVRVSMLRMRLLAHFGELIHDVVLAGPDRDYVAAMFFPSPVACRKLCGGDADSVPLAEVYARGEVRSSFLKLLNSFAEQNNSNSTRVERALLLDDPPSMEAREITDKGTINQAAVRKNRNAQLETLYQEPPAENILQVSTEITRE